jgi:hypothetical protein
MMAGVDVFVGPYYQSIFAGKQGGAQLDFKNTYNRDEVGINFGFSLKISYIRMEFTRKAALTNFTQMKNADGAHIRNRASFVNISFTF